jgi:hypothetical protein
VVAEVGNRQHRYLTILQSTPVGAVAFELLHGEVLAARVRYEEAAAWHYDELDPYFGPARELRADLRVQPHPRVVGEASVIFGDLRRPTTGRVAESSLIVRGEVQAALPGEVTVRLIGEGNSEEDRVDADALIEWELLPGATLAGGYGGRFPLDRARPAQLVFAKGTLRW